MNGMQENEWKAGKRRLGMNGMRANELNAGKQLEFLKDRIEKSHLTHLISLPSPLLPHHLTQLSLPNSTQSPQLTHLTHLTHLTSLTSLNLAHLAQITLFSDGDPQRRARG